MPLDALLLDRVQKTSVSTGKLFCERQPDLILGGWSLGSRLALHAAGILEACSVPVRFVFFFDDRIPLGSPPGPPSKGALQALHCEASKAFRLAAAGLNFSCPQREFT
eukprot:TRINITY_DN23612_c0_g3_i1.p2 TRINITY_DN23612_c0_g3~~TRINITY_DN23612_c0_g3_i1.p2  ORF type:complete len:108 (-),score=28.56 TRINITY_DN23612_c0_g3_i1:754-1077(-)